MKKDKTAEEILREEIETNMRHAYSRHLSEACKRAWIRRKAKKANGSNKVK